MISYSVPGCPLGGIFYQMEKLLQPGEYLGAQGKFKQVCP